MLTVRIDYDPDAENPCENDGWKVHSFGRRHINFRHPESLGLSLEMKDGLPKIRNPGLRRKMTVGLAHWLSYYEHGESRWSLMSGNASARCPWDSVQVGGILIWEECPTGLLKGLERRTESAEQFIESYTRWCNGQYLCYSIKDENGTTPEGCCGYDCPDALVADIATDILSLQRPYVVTGDASDLEQKLRMEVRRRAASRQEALETLPPPPVVKIILPPSVNPARPTRILDL